MADSEKSYLGELKRLYPDVYEDLFGSKGTNKKPARKPKRDDPGLDPDIFTLGKVLEKLLGAQGQTPSITGPIGPRQTLPFSGGMPSGPLINFLGGSPVPIDPRPEQLRNALALVANTMGALKARREKQSESR